MSHRERRTRTACTSAAGCGARRTRRCSQGSGNYVDDITLPGVLWAAFVRSPEAHARIASIDTVRRARARRRARPSTPAPTSTSRRRSRSPGSRPASTSQAPPHWPLAKEVVKHVGDPVAVVIGTDRYAVVDAAEDVIVDYDPLPVVVDPEAALAGGDLVHPDLGTNKVHEWSLGGDVESALEAPRS